MATAAQTLTPTGVIANETTTVQALTPDGVIRNETVSTTSVGGAAYYYNAQQ